MVVATKVWCYRRGTELKDDYDLKHLITAEVDGLLFSTTTRFNQYYLEGNFEKQSITHLKGFLKPGDVFVDVGAHHGYYSLLASKLIGPEGNVYAFEPVPENRVVLRRNIEQNKSSNIIVLEQAVSNKDGDIVEFNIPWASDSAGLFTHPLAQTIRTIKVPLATIDNVMSGKRVDFIKIDTEGNEVNVLGGMAKTIRKNPELKILIEFNPKCLKQASHKPEDLLNALQELDFDIYMTDEAGGITAKIVDVKKWRHLMPHPEYCNLFCLPKKLSASIEIFSSGDSLKREPLEFIVRLAGELQKHNFLPCVIASFKQPKDLRQILNSNGIQVKVIKPHQSDRLLPNDDKTTVAQLGEYWALLSKLSYDAGVNINTLPLEGAMIDSAFGVPHYWVISEEPNSVIPEVSDFITEYSAFNFVIPSGLRKQYIDYLSPKNTKVLLGEPAAKANPADELAVLLVNQVKAFKVTGVRHNLGINLLIDGVIARINELEVDEQKLTTKAHADEEEIERLRDTIERNTRRA